MSLDAKRGNSSPPSILLITGNLSGGGAERVLSDMANYWARKGWAVSFATWSGPEVEDFYDLDGRVKRVRLNLATNGNSAIGKIIRNLHRVIVMRKIMSELQPNAILSFLNTSNVRTILASVGLNLKVVVSERVQPAADTTISLIFKILRRIVYAWSDEIVVQTDDAANWIQRYCRKQPIVIPNPLRPLPEIKTDRQPLIVAVGRLAHQKGFDVLLKAFAKIASQFSTWNVAIIGEGDQHEALLRMRDELALTERVRFLGQVRDIESWMARAGLVVQPSRFEGFPNVLLESMGTGAPVIATDCPSGPSLIIQDGVNGRLVRVDDVESLANAMAELISQPNLSKLLGQEAMKVRERYRQDKIMDQWERCLFGQA